MRGYRFGESNHAVYLIDALRRSDPALLQNDWWTQSTLQYHFAFNTLTAALMRLGVVQPAFLAGYLALAVLLHAAWRRLVLRLGGSDGAYLLSVILYYLLAGGVGLGMYHFLQDSAFLPSNIANVAMLWGLYFLITGAPASAGICLGLAGLFHINHALAGIGLWAGMTLFDRRGALTRGWIIGTLVLLALCAVQIIPAIRAVFTRSGKLPLAEFVDLFVRFRHPHHFDPTAWHWGVWLAFVIPVPLAAVAHQAAPATAERRRAALLFALFAAMLVFALLSAGFWFFSETLIHLNLYRFSIYPKLLSSIAVAWLMWDRVPVTRRVAWWTLVALTVAAALALGTRPQHHNLHVVFLFLVLSVMALASAAEVRGRPIGWMVMPSLVIFVVGLLGVAHRKTGGIMIDGLSGDESDYRSLGVWARDNTPKDAVFLVPPDEESFRLHARRAIVVNFKGVPQLSGELPQWRDRLLAVLDFKAAGDLLALPRPMGPTLAAIRARYDALPPGHLFSTARAYGARYVVLTRKIDPPTHDATLSFDNGRYFLYDLNRQP